ncbi:MAG: universal stress protein [Bernardetiaceae bacterium]
MQLQKIFVPVDFSPNAYQALRYATAMAAQTGAAITVAHIFEIKMAPDGINMPPADYIHSLTEAKTGEIERYMATFIEQLGHPTYATDNKPIVFQTLVQEGFLVSELIALTQPGSYDLIVMGTKGANGIARLLWGTVTAEVIEKAKIPVLAVPEAADFQNLEKIVYATDLKIDESPNIETLRSFAEIFGARLTCLHISTTAERVTEGAQRMLSLEEKFYFTPISKLDFKLLRGERVEQSLQEYLDAEQPQMIAMKPHQRGFIDNLFHASMTRKMVLHTSIPLLTLK